MAKLPFSLLITINFGRIDIDEKTNKDNILTEIDYELDFDNSEREDEE